MSLIDSSSARSQQLGFIIIGYTIDIGGVNATAKRDPRLGQDIIRLGGSLPIRRASAHVCINDPKIELLMKMIRPLFLQRDLSRFQFHFGT